MDATTRRKQILAAIERAAYPITAKALSDKLGVSRQVIVGDVALLRAQGHEITATSRGYILNVMHSAKNQYLGKIVSKHTVVDTKSELYKIVDLDGTIVDVSIEHNIYGNITGSLNLKSRADVDNFIERLQSSQDKLLLELTDHGVHQHTIACRDKNHFEHIIQVLAQNGFIHEIFP